MGTIAVRKLLTGLAVVLLLTWFLGWHWYLIQRLVVDPELPSAFRTAAVFVIALLACSVLLHPLADRRLRPELARWLVWPATLWMGVGFWLLLLALGSDLFMWLASAVAFADEGTGAEVRSAARARAVGMVGIASLAFLPALRAGLSEPRVKRIAIPLPRWPREWAGFRVVQISDVHIGAILKRDFARRLTERVNELDPDLIAVTGDLVDGPVSELSEEVAPFAGLHARHGVYFVTGNHDHYSGANPWVERVRELGMRVLRNQRETIHPHQDPDAGSFELAGVDDYRARFMSGDGGADLDKALADLPPDRFVLLLAHDPIVFKRAASMGVDLQLSGHTHGGQLWPFHYFVRLATPFVAGLHLRDAARLYVSRGTGFWGPPMRLFAPAEITEITLLPGDDEPSPQNDGAS